MQFHGLKLGFIFLVIMFAACSNSASSDEILTYVQSQLPLEGGEVTSLAFRNDGNSTAIGFAGGGIQAMSLDSLKLEGDWRLHNKSVTAIAFDPSEEYMLSGSKDKNVSITSLKDFRQSTTTIKFGDAVRSINVSPSGRIAAVSGDSKNILLIDIITGEVRGWLKGHKKDVVFAGFGASDNELISVGKDRKVIAWNVSEQRPSRSMEITAHTIENSGLSIRSAALAPDASLLSVGIEETVLAKGGRDMIFKYTLAVYEWPSLAEQEVIENLEKNLDLLTFAPDSDHILTDNSTLRENKLELWSTRDANREATIPLEREVSAMAFSPDGALISAATKADDDKPAMLTIWSVEGIKRLYRVPSRCRILAASEDLKLDDSMILTVAILPFDAGEFEPEIGSVVRSVCETELVNSKTFTVLESQHIDKIIAELELAQSELTVDDALKIGRLLQAQHMVLGTIHKLESKVLLNIRLVSVEQAMISGAWEAECDRYKAEDVVDLVRTLANMIAE